MAYVREAVALLGRADRIVIKVHPGDLERLTREVQTLERTSGQESILRFEADSRLRPGECLAETANRSIDARISAQLTALEQQVRRADRAA
jgi:flagellar biosynthesis/type III secretory pathway protein FliH